MGIQLINDCTVHITPTMRQIIYQHEIIMKRLQRMSVLNDHKQNFTVLEPNANCIQHTL